MVFDHWTPCDLDFLVCGRISLWESQEGPTFPIKNILTCHQSWFLDGVGVISFYWRGSWSPPGLDIKPWLGVFLHGCCCCCCWSLLCVSLTTAITNYCPQGERHPLQDCPFCLFTSPFISLSRYPLRLPMCMCVCGGGLCWHRSRGERSCISALHISSSSSFSPPGFSAFGQSDPLIYPLPDIKSVGEQQKK